MVQKNNQLQQMSIKSISAGTISLIRDFKESRNSLCFDLRIIQSKQETQNIFFQKYKNETLQHRDWWLEFFLIS